MAAPSPVSESTHDWLAELPDAGAEWARRARAEAAERLRAMGLPSKRDEYWRWTDPADLLAPEPPACAPLDTSDETPPFAAIDRVKLVFVDGVFDPARSDAPELEGVEIVPLAEAMAADIHGAARLYGVLEARGHAPVPRPLAALNTARAREGFVIRVTGKAARPVSFIYEHVDARADAMIHHVVEVAEGAELTILENGPAGARSNIVIEADIAPGGRLHHVRAQGRDHERRCFTALFARLAAGSVFKSFTLTANGVLTRNEMVVEFTGDEAVAHLAGASVGDGQFHHDDTVFVIHDAVACESRQVFKKVLRNGAVGVFQGKILVRPGAQKTDGYQLSQGLMLDGDSTFEAKPELEIYADDVACSHGSTVGSIDETALFYLMSRGVPRAQAQDMLTLAFLGEAVEEIEDEALAEDMREKLAGWLARHHG